MENGSIRRPGRDVNSRPGAAWILAAAALVLGALPAVRAQDEPLEVTLQVLDDVSTIEGVLMPLEEEPERGANADSAAPAENPPPEAAKGEDR